MPSEICIVTFPEAGRTQIPNLVSLLETSGTGVRVIGQDGIRAKYAQPWTVHEIPYEAKTSAISATIEYLRFQVSAARQLFRWRRNLRYVVFFIGGEGFLLTHAAARLLGLRTLLLLPGNTATIMESKGDRAAIVFRALLRLSIWISSQTSLYSSRLLKDWNLSIPSRKLVVLREHVVDTGHFSPASTPANRPPRIGFVGRLSPEKGIHEFLACVKLFNQSPEIEFAIYGDGSARSAVEQVASQCPNLHYGGWVDRAQLPTILNSLKILVIPSHTEGLPNIMLEAMATGTIVLASPVGAIPDVLDDGRTGFLLTSRDPESMAQSIRSILSSIHLNGIASNSLKLMRDDYGHEKVAATWREALSK